MQLEQIKSIGIVPEVDAVKLEYSFLASHLNSLVMVRYTYFGTYLAAFGWLATKSISLFTLVSALIITLTVWALELRTRVIIRACTKRLVEIEELQFEYRGFFRKNHRYQAAGVTKLDDRRTTIGVKEPFVWLGWKSNIPDAIDFSGVMDFFFNVAVLAILCLIAIGFKSPETLAELSRGLSN